MKQLIRYRVGELPLVNAIAERMNLRKILYDFLPTQRNEEIPTVEVLILLIYNLTIGKNPLYELDQWVRRINLEAIGLGKYECLRFTDDRFGKALDRLYKADRAGLMTRIVIEVIETFNIDLKQFHNDSTTIKAFGEYPRKANSGLQFLKGKSKDHRPDLKQLVYSLTISNDGSVPIHYKAYPGNRNDDTTHIETWETLVRLCSHTGFTYVADCKLCTDRQLSYIHERGGRAVTTVPENWKEVSIFKDSLRKKRKKYTEIWRKNVGEEIIYYYVFDEECYSRHRGFRVYWYMSTDRRVEDYEKRERQLNKAEIELTNLLSQINKRNLKTKEAIQKKCGEILKKRGVERFLNVKISSTTEKLMPTAPKRKSKKGKKIIYVLTWKRNKVALKEEEKVDGIFPLLTTDNNYSAKETLLAFKYQPKLEKRFSQFKSIHNAAPIFFKKIERVEANMFLFFISLMLQALIEREIRNKMAISKVESIAIYPEYRESVHPTTNKIFDVFSDVSTYEIVENNDTLEHYRDQLSEIQLIVLGMLGIPEALYWKHL
jgi:transposase